MIVYATGGTLVILACVAVLVVGSLPKTAGQCPDLTAWGPLDFARNCQIKGGGGIGTGESLTRRLKGCRGIKGRELAKRMGFDVVVDEQRP